MNLNIIKKKASCSEYLTPGTSSPSSGGKQHAPYLSMSRMRKGARLGLSPAVLTVIIVTVIATSVAWYFARLNERDHIRRMTALATSAISADLNSDMEAWLLGQIRLARMWEFGEPTYQQWSAFAGLYLEHHRGCIAIEWLDPKYEERWVSRTDAQKVPFGTARTKG